MVPMLKYKKIKQMQTEMNLLLNKIVTIFQIL